MELVAGVALGHGGALQRSLHFTSTLTMPKGDDLFLEEDFWGTPQEGRGLRQDGLFDIL